MNALLLPGLSGLESSLGLSPLLFWTLFGIAALISLLLKGFALWYSARNYQKPWFIAILVINTFGLLEIIYLIWFRKDRGNRTQSLFNTPDGPELSRDS